MMDVGGNHFDDFGLKTVAVRCPFQIRAEKVIGVCLNSRI
jgi:hypothetical protein